MAPKDCTGIQLEQYVIDFIPKSTVSSIYPPKDSSNGTGTMKESFYKADCFQQIITNAPCSMYSLLHVATKPQFTSYGF